MIAGDKQSAKRFVWFCMTPVIVFLIVVALAPTIVAITDSLRDLSLTVFTKRGAFIGLENYRDLLGHDYVIIPKDAVSVIEGNLA